MYLPQSTIPSASNRLAANVPAKNTARGTVSESKVVQVMRNTVKTLQPFEQLKQHEGFIREGYNAQQRESVRRSGWIAFLQIIYHP
jgi:hypothetical protein